MKDFDNSEKKDFRKQKIESKKKNKTFFNDNYEEQRFAKLNKKNIKRKIEEMQEEEKWEDWEDEIY